jgi:diaminohydroxyphosphoribosylaminopyrimidine deaminase/5-amino-6-(5-phosphoribosylamino)uracil reductase
MIDKGSKEDEIFMQRCIDLAYNGLGKVAPNPMVGAVLVNDGKIIGEGYHHQFGHPHAEVNAINDAENRIGTIPQNSKLYVNLEPCNHHGKTPPCSELIINKGIKRIVIGSKDPNDKVAGKGIERLKFSGCEVLFGIIEKECIELNKTFFTYHEKHGP